MPSSVDCCYVECIAETVERQRARQRNCVSAINKPAAEAAFAFGKQVKMNTRGVLIKTRCNLMFGFLDGDTIDMVDSVTGPVGAESVMAARQFGVIGGVIDRRTCRTELRRLNALWQVGDLFIGCRRGLVAFADHDPAGIVEHGI